MAVGATSGPMAAQVMAAGRCAQALVGGAVAARRARAGGQIQPPPHQAPWAVEHAAVEYALAAQLRERLVSEHPVLAAPPEPGAADGRDLLGRTARLAPGRPRPPTSPRGFGD